jgi:hypothetical protein
MGWPVNGGEDALLPSEKLGSEIAKRFDDRRGQELTRVSPTSKALGSNPKDLLGVKKPSLTKIPAIGQLWEALAMMDGAGKYDPYNWRANKVVASIYIDACKRHLDAWFEGQEKAEDSGVHHLGHAKACLGILLDAQATGNLIDDRPVTESSSAAYQKALSEVMAAIPAMQERHREFHTKKNAPK